ncbi:citrate:succinate antiporter [Virgibacillus dakarensis]|uniref:Sodium:sulfate symporter n=1 Tax=Lentibacillus populi TaxID=1827502 RepID=A0A9W5TZ61_9BACI|nr:SLC13 family permease [Lentibacillus populi]MTW85211.1 citrate:succinate antiporter [Virgibacillus dakarensis]GGB48676.1 sodium:sulfate symporter [Lentibacillus populi]
MKKKLLLILIVILYILFFSPLIEWSLETKALGALIIIQILWIGRVFPLAFSSVLLILLLSFHFFSYDETLSYFGSSLVWLLFSIFILSHAFISTGLASRISLYILTWARGSGKLLLFVSFLLSFILTFFIPSNIGKGSLISSILHDIISSLKKIQATSNLSKSFFIGITYVSPIAAAFVPTGASSTIYAFGMFSSISDTITYFHWMLYLGLPIFIFIFLLWILFQRVFPVEKVDQQMVKNLIRSKMDELGSWSSQEVKMIFIMGITLLLWLTEPLHGYSIPLIGLLGASLTVLPSIGVMDWDEAQQSVDWNMMIFFSSTLMLSNMLINTGLIETVAAYVVEHSQNFPTIFLVMGLIVFTAFIRVVFVNVLGFLTIMLPLAITLGEQIAGISPLTLAMGVYLAGVPGFLLITQSPVHLISYSYGYFTHQDLLRAGFLSMLIWVCLVFVSIFLYWGFVI